MNIWDAKNATNLPDNPGDLAKWFAEGVRDEINALEKSRGSQEYEVISGRLISTTIQKIAIYQFQLVDATRIPEEASGILKVGNERYSVKIASQKANHLDIEIESYEALPKYISRAILVVDDIGLLLRLEEVLGEIVNTPSSISPLATTMFHPEEGITKHDELPRISVLVNIEKEIRKVLEQASSSSLTYIWGPPGTGKTFTLAHLIAIFVERGDRVLVTSHTNAAVDQALYETIKSEKRNGPLFEHPIIHDRKLLRIRKAYDRKLPHCIQLESIISERAAKLESTIIELEHRTKQLKEKRTAVKTQILEWEKLFACGDRISTIKDNLGSITGRISKCEEAIAHFKALVSRRRRNLEKAQRAWFLRKSKIERSTQELEAAKNDLNSTSIQYEKYKYEANKGEEVISSLQMDLNRQRKICEALPSVDALTKEKEVLTSNIEAADNQINSIHDTIAQLERQLISEARVVFCTLTKNYIGKELDGELFDVVIADEISMALPAVLFLAAGRATFRVILIGDFLQLPPIIRSDSPISNERLGTNSFQLAGLATELEAISKPALARLSTQHRMVPAIADVARELVYGGGGDLKDHHTVVDRPVHDWLNFLPDNPLVIVDTADLNCWSGKQPGSLSRFNIYSATVAVELAAMAAANQAKPSGEISRPIGIVTPFAAQRRLLGRLVNELNLRQWVQEGTVHTFQGGQAELIIFDSVLDEPYYSSRLTNPNRINKVLKDLNVAVTRSKDKFVFIGSSEWLNSHARLSSGLGKLWAFLKERADLVSAVELVELGFTNRIADHAIALNGWQLPLTDDHAKIHEILDENSFYERFIKDLANTKSTVFGLVPYFGQYRWPRIQPLFNDALARHVEVTLITPPINEAENPRYVENVIRNLRKLGAVIVESSGLHGKDIILDEKILYTGSLNWASHRGRQEIMHRIISSDVAKKVLEYMQARHIRAASVHEDRTPRRCPCCGHPVWIVNQKRQHGQWDFQALKVGCMNPDCRQYLRNVDERPPFVNAPLCRIDGQTKYRRVKRGRGETWQCPKHPKECPRHKVVPGDP